jgi:hypothetical protein
MMQYGGLLEAIKSIFMYIKSCSQALEARAV